VLASTPARLVVDGSVLDVDLVGEEDVDCAEAVGFAVVFALDASALPSDVTLAGHP
jgi:hypothetical protein